ncbi:sensor histidine kinase [Pseudofrankia inefficax]|uniref:histidine kinase n=1 Tax=Pseudofrankia inefficax (strain DSM 45817 / CECT 9037 / DDB 130130 / EuI1c) TaxID=298654 RepID=E3J7X1_PSEI1|nr:HAMP domain-containing sensor histidine kinase [Pseudofrankia inefficax]ADP82019.1 integral membrane sensor signal transduction histidine kinase [Pseudofrankia inefficax]
MTEASRVHRWWGRRSLRTRLTAAATVVIAAALCVAAAFLAQRLHAGLIRVANSNATQRLDQTVGVLRAADATGPLPPSRDSDVIVQVIGADGEVLSSSPTADPARPMFGFVPSPGARVLRATSRLPLHDSADSYRVAAQEITIGGSPIVVYVAVPADDAADTVAALGGALAVGLPIVLAVLATITWRLVGRALRPVDELRRQAAEITATDLHRRLDLPLSRDEVYNLAATFNDLLGRLEAATRRQREFVANAAHELRSPIASLQAQLEVAAATQPPATIPAHDLRGPLADAGRLSDLVNDLLHLARLDDRPRLSLRPVDLDDVVLDEARRVRLARPIAVATGGVSAGQVLGEPAALARVVHNLLDNATRHARSRVEVTLRTTGAVVVLTVADDGPGIPTADRERIFDRFTRLGGEVPSDGGSGLGLAIVREVLTAHDGTVRVTTAAPELPGARFEVRIPAVTAGDDGADGAHEAGGDPN